MYYMQQNNRGNCNNEKKTYKLLKTTYVNPKQYEAYSNPEDYKELKKTYVNPKQYEAYSNPNFYEGYKRRGSNLNRNKNARIYAKQKRHNQHVVKQIANFINGNSV